MSDIKPEPTDFFDSSYGYFKGEWRASGHAKDMLYDARLRLNPSYLTLSSRAKAHPQRNILIVGVEVPARAQDLKHVMQALSATYHRVTTRFATLGEGLGKFQNINAALKDAAMDEYDWLIVVDDDISFAERFLDNFIYIAEKANLSLCMPAHRFRSFQSYEVTRRHWNSLARVTHFVECGPLTAFRRDIFPDILPFPELRWSWATDIAWAEIARRKGFRIGVVDATPIRHLRPVAASYKGQAARDEARAFLKEAGVARERENILQTLETISSI